MTYCWQGPAGIGGGSEGKWGSDGHGVWTGMGVMGQEDRNWAPRGYYENMRQQVDDSWSQRVNESMSQRRASKSACE